MKSIVADRGVVGLIRNLVPLRAEVADARFPFVGQPRVGGGILEQFFLIVGSWNVLALKFDFSRWLLLLGLKEVIDLGPSVGRHREIRILIHRIKISVGLLVAHIFFWKEIWGHRGIA